MRSLKNTRRAWTIIETFIVLTILGIMAVIFIPQFMSPPAMPGSVSIYTPDGEVSLSIGDFVRVTGEKLAVGRYVVPGLYQVERLRDNGLNGSSGYISLKEQGSPHSQTTLSMDQLQRVWQSGFYTAINAGSPEYSSILAEFENRVQPELTPQPADK